MKLWIFALALVIVPLAYAQCISLNQGQLLTVSSDAELCPGSYPEARLTIIKDNITLDCNNAVLVGSPKLTAITVSGAHSTVVKNCRILGYGSGYASQFADPMNPDFLYNSTFENNTLAVRIGGSNSFIHIEGNIFT